MRYDKCLNILWGVPDMADITADAGTKRVWQEKMIVPPGPPSPCPVDSLMV